MRGFKSISEIEKNETLKKERIAKFLSEGVLFCDFGAEIAPDAEIGEGTLIKSGVVIGSGVKIGKDCVIGPNSVLENCEIGNGVTVNSSEVTDCKIGDKTTVGPFAHLRGGCKIGAGCRIGNFVELKNAVLDDGSKVSHLSYIGDAELGKRVNMGCGSITVNYDGAGKYKTVIGDDAFVGCNANLIAPVKIGSGTLIAAGSTIHEDVPDDALAIARCRQTVKEERAPKIFEENRRKKKEADLKK